MGERQPLQGLEFDAQAEPVLGFCSRIQGINSFGEEEPEIRADSRIRILESFILGELIASSGIQFKNQDFDRENVDSSSLQLKVIDRLSVIQVSCGIHVAEQPCFDPQACGPEKPGEVEIILGRITPGRAAKKFV